MTNPTDNAPLVPYERLAALGTLAEVVPVFQLRILGPRSVLDSGIIENVGGHADIASHQVPPTETSSTPHPPHPIPPI